MYAISIPKTDAPTVMDTMKMYPNGLCVLRLNVYVTVSPSPVSLSRPAC